MEMVVDMAAFRRGMGSGDGLGEGEEPAGEEARQGGLPGQVYWPPYGWVWEGTPPEPESSPCRKEKGA